MRKSKNRVRLQVEAMESRALLSALVPVSSVPVRYTVFADFGTNLETQATINSVRLQNNAGHNLAIKAFFKTETSPTPIPHPDNGKVIPAGRFGDFTFRPSLVGFIWIELKRQESRGPFTRPLPLSKPDRGYNGARFNITFSNGVYSVSGPNP